MVKLDFFIDEEVLKEERMDPPEEELSALSICFMMPVSLNINGVEMFQFQDDGLVSIALLDLASDGLYTVATLFDGEEAVYEAFEDAGKYYFRRDGDIVHVRTDANNHTATCLYSELLQAFEEIQLKVRSFLLKEFPALINHPRWGAWFRGEKKYVQYNSITGDFD